MLQRTHIGISIGLPVVKFIAPSHGVCECPQESCGIEVGVLNPHHGSKTKKNIVVLFRTRTYSTTTIYYPMRADRYCGFGPWTQHRLYSINTALGELIIVVYVVLKLLILLFTTPG